MWKGTGCLPDIIPANKTRQIDISIYTHLKVASSMPVADLMRDESEKQVYPPLPQHFLR